MIEQKGYLDVKTRHKAIKCRCMDCEYFKGPDGCEECGEKEDNIACEVAYIFFNGYPFMSIKQYITRYYGSYNIRPDDVFQIVPQPKGTGRMKWLKRLKTK